MATYKSSIACIMLIALSLIGINTSTAIAGWDFGHATFYGDVSGHEAEGGACGYTSADGYGVTVAALSTALFNGGQTCGACYEIMCVNDPQWCKPGSIKITATNFCPPSTGSQAWCNPPLKHFDLSEPMFLSIVKSARAGIVPVRFQRIQCTSRGGIKFGIKGNPNFLLVLVYNVGGAGEVVSVKIKGSKTGWIQMKRSWGQNWQVGGGLVGQTLSFQVTTSDGRSVLSNNVAPTNWAFGRTYEGRSNF